MKSKEQYAEDVSTIMPRIAHAITSSFVQSVRMPPAQIFTLLALQEHGSCRFSDLSKRFGVSAPTVTGIIDRLEKAGYVQRVPDVTDRRAINVSLTRKGSRESQKIRVGVKKRWLQLLERIPSVDCETFLNIIIKIETQLHKKSLENDS